MLGYHQNFDVEGDSGIVGRTYGTSVLLARRRPNVNIPQPVSAGGVIKPATVGVSGRSSSGNIMTAVQASSPSTGTANGPVVVVNATVGGSGVGGNSESKPGELSLRTNNSRFWDPRHREDQDDDQVQLLTLRDFGPFVRIRFGGLVTARSVKYLGNLESKLSDQETRDSW